MSPEQLRGETLSVQTDIFSLGIVFWELLAKRKLFTGKTIEELTEKVKECRIPSVIELDPSIPPELNRICLKALTHQPHARYQKMSQMISDLNDFLRLTSSDSRERSLAKAMIKLFPNDVDRIRNMFKIYESPQEKAIYGSGAWGMTGGELKVNADMKSKSQPKNRLPKENLMPFYAVICALLVGAFSVWMWPGLVTGRSTRTPAATQPPKQAPMPPAHAPRTEPEMIEEPILKPTASAKSARKPSSVKAKKAKTAKKKKKKTY